MALALRQPSLSGAAQLIYLNGTVTFRTESDAGIAYYERGQGGIGRSPWQLPERYRENSPFFYLDRVLTPLLIERGTEDLISEANGAIYNSLQRRGSPVELI